MAFDRINNSLQPSVPPASAALTQHAKHVVVSGGDANIKQLFCQVAWKGDAFNLLATDASQTWSAQDAVAPPLGEHSLQPQQYLAVCRDALCARKPQRLYAFRADLDTYTQALQLRIQFEWQPGEWVVISLELQHVQDHTSALAGMLQLLTDGYATLLDQVGSLDQVHAQLESQLQTTQAALTQERQANTAKEQELYVKFSLLLNSKKAKLRELQQQCQDQQDQIATLEAQLAGSGSPQDLDDTDLDRAEDAASVELMGQSPHDDNIQAVDKPDRNVTTAGRQLRGRTQPSGVTNTSAVAGRRGAGTQAAQQTAMEVDGLEEQPAGMQRPGLPSLHGSTFTAKAPAYTTGTTGHAHSQPNMQLRGTLQVAAPAASLDTEAAFAGATLPPSYTSDLGGSATLPIASEAPHLAEPGAGTFIPAHIQQPAAMQADAAEDGADEELDLGL